MNTILRYMPQFVDDFNSFSEHDRIIIRTALQKLSENPFSKKDGGYGNIALKEADGRILTAKIIFTDIRIVYKIMKSKDNTTLIIYTAVTNDTATRR